MKIDFLRINKNNCVAFLSLLLTVFISSSVVHAQTSAEDKAVKYGIKFPISELGGCKNMSECRQFCEDPVNYPQCINFAKSKGFYKEEEINADKKRGVLEKAKTELGCDSIEACKNFCQIPTNFEKCDAFAKEQGISGGQVEDPKKEEVLNKAKEVLGCESYTSCAALCSDDANRQKCTEFAKEVGLNGGERQVGPGGCTSEESCKAFCSDPANFQVCKGFVTAVGGKFHGPGGCDSEDNCKSYCQQHKSECQVFGKSSAAAQNFSPQEMCNRTPACSWNNNTCQCENLSNDQAKQKAEEFAKFCKVNPQKCTPGGVGGLDSQQDRSAAENYCKDNSDKCRPEYSQYTGTYFDPVLECAKYQGCSWQGGKCNCSNSMTNTQNTQDWQKSCSAGGCTWTESGCDCSQASSDAPSMACTKQTGCSWINSTCQCASYKTSSNTELKSGSGNSPQTYTPTNGTTSNSNGNTMSRDQQEAACRAGGGSCTWNGDICNCQGYRAPSKTTNTGSSGANNTNATDPATACRNAGGNWNGSMCQMPNTSTSNTTQNIAPSGMSRDQQETGCRSCGGTCNWNGDFCQCQCASSGLSGSNNTQQPSQPAVAPAQPAPTQVQPATTPAPVSSPSVQGVFTVRGFLNEFFDFLSKLAN